MSFAEIEAELQNLSSDELRRLALKSWTVLVEKESGSEAANECSEHDPRLLAALDEAIAQADASPGRGHSAVQVRARLSGWTSECTTESSMSCGPSRFCACGTAARQMIPPSDRRF